MDVVEWLSKALADPTLAPLRKLLGRRGLPSELRSSVEAFVEAEADLRAYIEWQQKNSCKLSATKDCDDITILAARNQDRWKDCRRERQYEELRKIIETIGCPLKRDLIANGFTDEEIRVRITFGLKLTPDGEALEIVPTTSELDYDAADDLERRSVEFEAARRGGCDRNGIWHPVFTVCGRVHGYFEENESREFERLWSKKHSWPELLLLDRITVSLTATPSEERYSDTLPAEKRRKMDRSRKAAEEARATRDAASAVPSGPTISASFLDFAEGADPPIRFQRGDLASGGKRRSRAVDRETSEYVERELPHWRSSTSYYRLFSADSTKICSSTVQQETVDLSGDGNVGLYKVRFLGIHQASADGSWSEVTDATAPIAQKLARFVAAFLVDHLPARHSAEITFDLGGKLNDNPGG
jgi:hypothetical protein